MADQHTFGWALVTRSGTVVLSTVRATRKAVKEHLRDEFFSPPGWGDRTIAEKDAWVKAELKRMQSCIGRVQVREVW